MPSTAPRASVVRGALSCGLAALVLPRRAALNTERRFASEPMAHANRPLDPARPARRSRDGIGNVLRVHESPGSGGGTAAGRSTSSITRMSIEPPLRRPDVSKHRGARRRRARTVRIRSREPHHRRRDERHRTAWTRRAGIGGDVRGNRSPVILGRDPRYLPRVVERRVRPRAAGHLPIEHRQGIVDRQRISADDDDELLVVVDPRILRRCRRAQSHTRSRGRRARRSSTADRANGRRAARRSSRERPRAVRAARRAERRSSGPPASPARAR